MANLVENLTTTAARYAARPALRVGGDTTTYAAFDEQTARVAGLIRSRGLELGDPVRPRRRSRQARRLRLRLAT